MKKQDIIEAYLNDVFLGESNYGVKAAAKDYFGKELSELTIRECAMLAGMVQSPNTTDPRKNTYERVYTSGDKVGQNKMDITNARTDKVINRMYGAGLISKEQRDAALADTVTILKTSARVNNAYENLYYIEYAIRQICSDILEQRGMLDTSANRSPWRTSSRAAGIRSTCASTPASNRACSGPSRSGRIIPAFPARRAPIRTPCSRRRRRSS